MNSTDFGPIVSPLMGAALARQGQINPGMQRPPAAGMPAPGTARPAMMPGARPGAPMPVTPMAKGGRAKRPKHETHELTIVMPLGALAGSSAPPQGALAQGAADEIRRRMMVRHLLEMALRGGR